MVEKQQPRLLPRPMLLCFPPLPPARRPVLFLTNYLYQLGLLSVAGSRKSNQERLK